jgi:quercetin dioxygenase-like cupin family protein
MGTYRIENWPSAPATMEPELQKEFAAHAADGRVGNELLSETDRVRVWAMGLKPGERLGFHTHVLDYFWTSVTGGQGRSHFSDGSVSDAAYKPGDIKQLTFKEGEFMVHDLENIGDNELLFTTVEFLDSPNAPLELHSHTRSAAEV